MSNTPTISRFKTTAKALAVALPVILLTACGGGGGGTTTTTGAGGSTGVVADTTPPTLAAAPAISPANGATGSAYAATVSFTASEALSAASITMNCDGANVTGTTVVSGAVVTFTPAAPGYAANAKCTATVNAAGTKDLAGNAFTTNAALTSFTVKTLACTGTTSNSPPSFNGTALVAACGNVFVDPTVAKNLYPAIVDGVATALQSDRVVYGTLQATQPDLIVCSTTACGTYFAGASLRNTTIPTNSFAGQYVAPRLTVVLTSATSVRNPFILAHEFSHAEVNTRIGGGHVAAWFDEGLATFVGGEPDCTGVTGKGITSLLTLDQEPDWVTYTGNSAVFNTTYCQARTEVAAWISKNGNAAIGRLLQAVGQGQNFTVLYGPMLTQ